MIVCCEDDYCVRIDRVGKSCGRIGREKVEHLPRAEDDLETKLAFKAQDEPTSEKTARAVR